MRRGFGLLEIVIVIAIVAIVSSLVFAGGQDAREKARQESCRTRLRGIDTAMRLYDNDHDAYTLDAGGQTYPIIPSPLILLPYLKSVESLHCPDRTDRMRHRFLSTYEFRNMIRPWDSPADPATRDVLEQIRQRGAEAPLVICQIHNEIYYVPREGNVAPVYTKPFVIELRANGTIFRGRMPYLRNTFFNQ